MSVRRPELGKPCPTVCGDCKLAVSLWKERKKWNALSVQPHA